MRGGARHPSKLGTFVISATTYLEILKILRFPYFYEIIYNSCIGRLLWNFFWL